MKAILDEFANIHKHYKYVLVKKFKKPITFHTEAIFNEKVWKEVQKFVKSGNKAIWFVITPVNYDFVKAEHGLRLSKKRYEKILLERYKWLESHGQEIQLHLHFSRLLMEMYSSNSEKNKEQKKMIHHAINWLRKNGFYITKITFGWWNYDKTSINLATKLGLKIIKEFEYPALHDFDLIRKSKPKSSGVG